MFTSNVKKLILPCICSGLSFFFWVGFFMVLLPVYIKTFQFSNELYGYAIAINSALVAAFSLPGGWLSDIFGRKKLIVIGWFTMGLGSLLLSQFVDWRSLLLSSGLIGLGWGLSGCAFLAYIADTMESRKLSMSYGILQSVSLLLSASGPYIIGYVIKTVPRGLTVGLWLLAGIMFSATFFALLLHETSKKETNRGIFSAGVFSKKEKKIVLDFSLAYLITGVGAGLTVPFYSIFFIERFRSTAYQLGIIFTISTICLTVATYLSGYLGDKVDKLKFFLLSNGITVPLALGIVIAPTLLLSGSFYIGLDMVANMIWPVWSAFFMIHITSKIRGKATGITFTIWSLAYMMGAALGGHFFVCIDGWVFPLAAMMYASVTAYIVYDLKKTPK